MSDSLYDITLKRKYRRVKNLISILVFLIISSNVILRTNDNITLYALISIVISVLVVFRTILRPSAIIKVLDNNFMLWITFLFALYFFYGLVLPKYDYFSFEYFLLMLVMIIMTMLLLVNNPSDLIFEIFVHSFTLSTVAISLYVLVNEFDSILTGGVRVGDSVSGNVNTLALRLGMLSIPALYKIIFESNIKYILPYTISAMLILLTGSKKGLLIIILGIVLFFVYKYKFNLHKYILPTIIVLILFVFIFTNEYLYNIIGYRIVDFLGSVGFEFETASTSVSTELRLSMNDQAIAAFKQNPFFGGGWSYFSYFSGLGTYSHNNYLELLVNYGLVGFSLYYSMYVILLKKLFKVLRVDNKAIVFIISILLILITDIASVSFSSNLLNYLILLIIYFYIKNNRLLLQKDW